MVFVINIVEQLNIELFNLKFGDMKKENGYWTIERCFDAAKKCKTKYEFKKKYSRAYHVLRENKLLEKCNFEQTRKPKGYWYVYENNKAEALKYKTRTDFEYGNGAAYKAARKMNWLDTYDWFVVLNNAYTDKLDNVYAYFFKDLNSVYVGRAVDVKKRDLQHRQPKKNDTVFKFASKNGVEIPVITILESGFDPVEGQIKEGFYVEKYKNDGWNIINKAKTGKGSSSLGKLGKGIWTVEKIKDMCVGCKTQNELRKKSGGCWVAGKNKGILDELIPKNRKDNDYWLNKENIIKHAKECTSKSDFKAKYPTGYKRAREYKIINYLFDNKIKPNHYWESKENCRIAAMECKTRTEFARKYGAAYNNSNDNGWLDDFYPKAA